MHIFLSTCFTCIFEPRGTIQIIASLYLQATIVDTLRRVLQSIFDKHTTSQVLTLIGTTHDVAHRYILSCAINFNTIFVDTVTERLEALLFRIATIGLTTW